MNIPPVPPPLCPHPHSEPQPPAASPGDPPRPAGRSGPGSCEVIALALRPCVQAPRVASLPPSALWSFCA